MSEANARYLSTKTQRGGHTLRDFVPAIDPEL